MTTKESLLYIGDIAAWEINASEMFADPLFLEWLNRRAGHGLATWYCMGQGKAGDYSDVFITFDHGEGDEQSDNPNGMPRHCWQAICEFCEEAGIDYGILRLINYEVEDDG